MNTTDTLTLTAEPASPHIHVDNRGVYVSNGTRAIMIPISQARWLSETLEIIATEGRATRTQRDQVFGGHRDDWSKGVTLYAGVHSDLIAVTLTDDAFEQLRGAVSQRPAG